MPQAIIVLKVDPIRRQITRMPMIPSIKGVRSLVKSYNIGWKRLLEDVDGEILLVAAKLDRDVKKLDKEWRLYGGDNTAGIGVMFGTMDRKLDGMWHCPVDVAWVEQRIVWCEPGENAPAAEIADAKGIPLFEGDQAGVEAAQGAQLEAQAQSPGGAPDGGREAPRVANDVEVEKGPGA